MNEIWKSIPKHENKYLVSNLGRIKRFNKVKQDFIEVNPNRMNTGYYRLQLKEDNKLKTYLLHRLVLAVFNPTNNNMLQVNHKDENKDNNSLENLEWVTPKKNMIHAFNVLKRKPVNVMNKVTLKIDISTGNIIEKYFSAREAARQIKGSCNKISDCCRGKIPNAYGFIWKYI